MAQIINMQRFDFVLGPAKQVAPGWVDAEEVAVEVSDAEQILRHLPDAVAFACALLYFQFKKFREHLQRLLFAYALSCLEGGGKHAADAVCCGCVRNRAVADCKSRFFREAVAIDRPRMILGEEAFAFAAQDRFIERSELIVDRPSRSGFPSAPG